MRRAWRRHLDRKTGPLQPGLYVLEAMYTSRILRGSLEHFGVGRLRSVLFGLLWGYPPCCVLRFALDRRERAWTRRGWRYGRRRPCLYIPCQIFHRADTDFTEQQRLPLPLGHVPQLRPQTVPVVRGPLMTRMRVAWRVMFPKSGSLYQKNVWGDVVWRPIPELDVTERRSTRDDSSIAPTVEGD